MKNVANIIFFIRSRWNFFWVRFCWNAVEREPVPTRVLNPKACGVFFTFFHWNFIFLKLKFFFLLKSFEMYQKIFSLISDEKKNFGQIFHFFFRVMVILVSFFWKKSPQFSMITRKIKIGEFFYYFSRSIQNTPHHS